MLGALFNAAVGVGILMAVLALWVGVQHLVRKSEKLPPDCDVLAERGHGCGHCNLHGNCALEPQKTARHSQNDIHPGGARPQQEQEFAGSKEPPDGH